LSKIKLYNYQEETVRRIEEFGGRSLLAIEMGGGKTLISLAWLKFHPDLRPAVVVCPASLKWQWQKEARRMGFSAEILNKSKPPKGLIDLDYPLLIINYDILHGWLKVLQSINPKVVIFDEIQMLKSPRTRRTVASRDLIEEIPHLLALSGTPIINRPIELYPILNMIRPDIYNNWSEFGTEFCKPRLTPWGIKYDGATNLDLLHKRLQKHCMIRYRTEDVLKDLPPLSRRIIPLEIEKRKEYELASSDYLKWLRLHRPGKETKAKRAVRLNQINGLRKLVGELKIASVKEWLESFLENSDQKMLIYGFHKKVLRELHQHFRKSSVLIDGSVLGRKRQERADLFQRNRKCRFLFGNYQAAGVGLNLQSACFVTFVELAWTPAEIDQAIKRAHRIGQSQKVIVNFLIARNTIEEYLSKLLQRKKKILDAVLDGRDATDFDLLEQLEKMMRRK